MCESGELHSAGSAYSRKLKNPFREKICGQHQELVPVLPAIDGVGHLINPRDPRRSHRG